MNTTMLRRSNSVCGASSRASGDDFHSELAQFGATGTAAKGSAVRFGLKALTAALVSVGLLVCVPSLAGESDMANKPQPQSEASKTVQPQVDKQASDAVAEKRKKLLGEATAALAQTQQALKALEEKKNEEALKALADVTGKLELIVARDPALALAPVSTTVVTHDLVASVDTVKAAVTQARRDLADGEVQKARLLIDTLASEVQIRTSNIPLATYPAAIKTITPLIDAGKVDEAKAALQVALGTLVITTDVIPLPKLRAEILLKDAQTLSAKKNRSKEDDEKLARELKAAGEQLEMAKLLGYGKNNDYKPLYEQIASIQRASASR